MMSYRLTQKKLGGIYLASIFIQFMWWAFFLSAYWQNINLPQIVDSFMSAPVAGKIFGSVLIASYFVYVRILYSLTLIGLRLYRMDFTEYHCLRIVGRQWRFEPFITVVPIVIICLALLARFDERDIVDVSKADALFSFLIWWISLGFNGLSVLHFNEADSQAKQVIQIQEFL